MGTFDDAIHANTLHAMGRVAMLGPHQPERFGPLLLTSSGGDYPLFNTAAVVETVDDPAGAFQSARDWYASKSPNFRFFLRDPHDRAFATWLELQDFIVSDRDPAMLLELSSADIEPHTPLEIHSVASDESFEWYIAADETPASEALRRDIARSASRLEGMTLFVGLSDAKPVATALACLHAGIVGVYNVYVQPGQRRKGFGRDITLAVLRRGLEAGVTHACLESTEMGLSLYEGMGFETQFHYLRMDPAGSPRPEWPQ